MPFNSDAHSEYLDYGVIQGGHRNDGYALGEQVEMFKQPDMLHIGNPRVKQYIQSQQGHYYPQYNSTELAILNSIKHNQMEGAGAKRWLKKQGKAVKKSFTNETGFLNDMVGDAITNALSGVIDYTGNYLGVPPELSELANERARRAIEKKTGFGYYNDPYTGEYTGGGVGRDLRNVYKKARKNIKNEVTGAYKDTRKMTKAEALRLLAEAKAEAAAVKADITGAYGDAKDEARGIYGDAKAAAREEAMRLLDEVANGTYTGGGIGKDLKKIYKKAKHSVKDEVTGAYKDVRKLTKDEILRLADVAKAEAAAVKSQAQGAYADTRSLSKAEALRLLNEAKNAKNDLKSEAVAAYADARSLSKAEAFRLLNEAKNAKNDVKSQAQAEYTNFKKDIKENARSSIQNALDDYLPKASEDLSGSGIGRDLKSVGKKVRKNVKNEVKAAVKEAKDDVKSAVKEAKATAKEAVKEAKANAKEQVRQAVQNALDENLPSGEMSGGGRPPYPATGPKGQVVGVDGHWVSVQKGWNVWSKPTWVNFKTMHKMQMQSEMSGGGRPPYPATGPGGKVVGVDGYWNAQQKGNGVWEKPRWIALRKTTPPKTGGGMARSKRAEIVKKIMAERGVSLPVASKIVKEEGLY